MVNYCCVAGCGRSSRLSKHLNFYTLPKEANRCKQWLKAAGRDDLLNSSSSKGTYRFCSRHFAPSSVRNRNLTPEAIPTLCLPSNDKDTKVPLPHHDIVCDSCKNTIMGFRYKCVTCEDYDLCPKCEMLETHSHHYMLRIPKPLKFKICDDLIKRWRSFFKAEHVKPDCEDDQSGYSSDDEPISKHVKNYDSGVDLSEGVKELIRNEVTRVLTMKPEDKKKKKRKKAELNKSSSKKMKLDKTVPETQTAASSAVEPVPEVAFADVNAYKDQVVDVKSESALTTAPTEDVPESTLGQPLMHVRLSDDLTELMIEMTNSGEKTLYRYS